MTDPTAEELIETLHLQPLPGEGGMYTQTFCGPRNEDGLPAETAIFYLLAGQDYSHLHRLSRNELYHFYLGDPVELTELLPDGSIKKTVLGQDVLHGQKLQHMVDAGNWQGSCLAQGGAYALLGTTMCPGYTPECYEHGDRKALLEQYPGAEKEILRLTITDTN